MNLFYGDYKTFYKFFGGYARNNTLSLTKKYKTGICACCGRDDAEIQSAHKRGCERKDLVKKWFEESVIEQNGDLYKISLDKFEQLFTDFSSDISNFHFLCEKCHSLYDKGLIEESMFLHEKESKKTTIKKQTKTVTKTLHNYYNSKGTNLSDEESRNLRSMGKSWFVSYLYDFYKGHKNWTKASQLPTRQSCFKNSKNLHKRYLEAVLNSDTNRLSTNQIDLSGTETKKLAQELLDNFDTVSQNLKYKFL